jgi:hypothetical protein
MDVHKDSIDIAVAEEAGEVRHHGRIGGDTPRRSRDRIKTDRRDSLKLAGLARAGELKPIYVPDAADEAMRDLVRAREDAVIVQRQGRQRLAALLLRNDLRYAGKTTWTEGHRRWISRLRLPTAAQRIAFEEYVQAVSESTERVERFTRAIEQELSGWRWQPVVAALQACRGIQLIHAVRIVVLANLYMRRFVLGWKRLGLERRLEAHIVNYADDRAPRRRREEAVM